MDDVDIASLTAPPTETAATALAVVRRFSDPAMVGHCLRSWVWANALAAAEKRRFDRELLYVATMLHDLGLTADFDAHEVPFEAAGGSVGHVFAAGAGWSAPRCERVREIIVRHMWAAVDPDADVEGYLLETATSLDVGGADPQRWDAEFLRVVEQHLPRRGFTAHFDARIAQQAVRKPDSRARGLHDAGRVRAGGAVWAKLGASV